MNSFNIVDLLLFLGICLGVFLAIALRLMSNRNKSANTILSYTLLIAALMLVGRITSFMFPTVMMYRIASFADTIIFIFGPLVYMYVRRLTFKESPEFILHFFHFIPALFHIIFFLWTLLYSLEEYGFLLNNGSFNSVYAIIEGAGLGSNIFYGYRSYLLVKTYQKEGKHDFSYSQKVTSFLFGFLFAILIFLFIWFVSYMNNYYVRIRGLYLVSYHLVWIAIPLYIYIIGFYSFKQPEIFRILKKKNNVIKKVEKEEY